MAQHLAQVIAAASLVLGVQTAPAQGTAIEPARQVNLQAQGDRPTLQASITQHPIPANLGQPRPLRPHSVAWPQPPGGGVITIVILGLLALGQGYRYDKRRWRQYLQLQQNHGFLSNTLDSLAEGVIITDLEGRIQFLNPAAQMLTGWDEEAARGRALGDVFLTLDEETAKPLDSGIADVLEAYRPRLNSTGRKLLISRSGEEYAIDDALVPIWAPGDGFEKREIQGAILSFRDVTQSRSLTRQLSWQASHDPLTGLVNRPAFEQQLQRAMAEVGRHQGEHTLCFIDLDCFKLVNDTCGHQAGDRLLAQVARLLQERVRRTDIVARLGGDEFAIIFRHCSMTRATAISKALCDAIQEIRFFWGEQMFTISASLGLAPVSGPEVNVADLMAIADDACYTAKRQGRGRVYACRMDEQAFFQQREEIQWVARIQQALSENRFCLYYQAIADLKRGGDTQEHYEVLIRLQGDDGRIISPAAFLPAAERYNLMPMLDRWVISTLFAAQAEHYRAVFSQRQQQGQHCIYTINLSGSSINDEQFIDFVQDEIERHRIPPQVICFEVTETVAIANLQKAAGFMQQLRHLGCKFALDDFGTGMSSLAYLKTLPIDFLKIDGCFVKEIVEDPVALAMVEAISHIGQVMGIQTITEFVSSPAILQKVTELGVDYAQGYEIAEPRPLVMPEPMAAAAMVQPASSGIAAAPTAEAGDAFRPSPTAVDPAPLTGLAGEVRSLASPEPWGQPESPSPQRNSLAA